MAIYQISKSTQIIITQSLYLIVLQFQLLEDISLLFIFQIFSSIFMLTAEIGYNQCSIHSNTLYRISVVSGVFNSIATHIGIRNKRWYLYLILVLCQKLLCPITMERVLYIGIKYWWYSVFSTALGLILESVIKGDTHTLSKYWYCPITICNVLKCSQNVVAASYFQICRAKLGALIKLCLSESKTIIN